MSELWTCPVCGQLFDVFVAAARENGDVTVNATKSRVEYVPPYYYVHRLRLSGPADVDGELKDWLAEAYQVGAQRHVDDPGWPRQRQPPPWVHVPREVADAIARGADPSTVR